jgi:hypothetical protein
LARWRSRRRKDRINIFCQRVLAIRERGEGEGPERLLEELTALESQAFESLIAERMAVKESFRNFTDLLTRTRAELIDR